jgi:hypothetical protein
MGPNHMLLRISSRTGSKKGFFYMGSQSKSLDLIAKVTSLSKEGLKLSKETTISNAEFKKFPKMEEEVQKLEKNRDF